MMCQVTKDTITCTERDINAFEYCAGCEQRTGFGAMCDYCGRMFCALCVPKHVAAECDGFDCRAFAPIKRDDETEAR